MKETLPLKDETRQDTGIPDVGVLIQQIQQEQQAQQAQRQEEAYWRLVLAHELLNVEVGRERLAFQLGFRFGRCPQEKKAVAQTAHIEEGP